MKNASIWRQVSPEENRCSKIVSEAILRLTAESNEGGYGRLVREGETTGMSKVWESCSVNHAAFIFNIVLCSQSNDKQQ